MLRTKIFVTVTILLAIGGLMASSHFTSTAQKPAAGVPTDPILEEIAAYREWKRVNKDTILVLPLAAGGSQLDLSGFG